MLPEKQEDSRKRRAGGGRGPHESITSAIGKARALRDGALLPLDYMLRIMRDEGADQRRRDEMAKAAAPYLHARYQAIAITPLPDEAGAALGMMGAQVHVYLPDNGRRAAPPDAANDASQTFGMVELLMVVAGGSLSE